MARDAEDHPQAPVGGLDTPLGTLARERERVLQEVRHMGEAGERASASGGWSAVQVAQHLMLAEEVSLSAMESGHTPRRRPLRSRIGRMAVKVVFGLGIKVSIPTAKVDPTPPIPLDEVESRWRSAAERMDAILLERGRADPRSPVLHHPVAGPLNAARTIDFLTGHIRHHRRQLKRIREATGSSGNQK